MEHKNVRVIKRYPNRKLYDTSDSCYVTLEDISELIKLGEDVEVIDNKTKEDLTAVTLAQIIFEEQKKKTNTLPLNTFKDMIRSGGETIKEIMQKTFASGSKEIETVRHFVDDKVRPAVESFQHLPAVQAELKNLKDRIESLEKKIKNYKPSRKKPK